MLLIFSDSSRLIAFFRKLDVCELKTVFDFKTLDSTIKEEATRGIIQKKSVLKNFYKFTRKHLCHLFQVKNCFLTAT